MSNTTRWAAGAPVTCSKRMTCGPSSPARLYSAPPTRTRPYGPPLDCLLGQPAPIIPGLWVGDCSCLPKQDGGWRYLAVWLDFRAHRVVGWDVRETMSAALVSEALRRALCRAPGSSCITPRAACGRPPYSRTYPPGTGPSKAGDSVATATTIPAPNRSGAGSKPNCPTRANFLIWPRLGSRLVTT